MPELPLSDNSKLDQQALNLQKMKFSVKDFFSKCDRIHKKLRIWSYLLNKSFMDNFIFCSVIIGLKVCYALCKIFWAEL